MTREQKLERILGLQDSIRDMYWDDPFSDEPEYHSNRRLKVYQEIVKLKIGRF